MSGHGVVAASAPWMAACEPFECEPCAFERSVAPECLEGVGAACGCEAAGGRQQGRYGRAVEEYGHAEQACGGFVEEGGGWHALGMCAVQEGVFSAAFASRRCMARSTAS